MSWPVATLIAFFIASILAGFFMAATHPDANAAAILLVYAYFATWALAAIIVRHACA